MIEPADLPLPPPGGGQAVGTGRDNLKVTRPFPTIYFSLPNNVGRGFSPAIWRT